MKIALALLLLSSTPALAITNQEIAAACKERGTTKVIEQAAAWNCKIDQSAITPSLVDNRWWNPSKYIWFAVPSEGCEQGLGVVQVLVQYYRGKCI